MRRSSLAPPLLCFREKSTDLTFKVIRQRLAAPWTPANLCGLPRLQRSMSRRVPRALRCMLPSPKQQVCRPHCSHHLATADQRSGQIGHLRAGRISASTTGTKWVVSRPMHADRRLGRASRNIRAAVRTIESLQLVMRAQHAAVLPSPGFASRWRGFAAFLGSSGEGSPVALKVKPARGRAP